MVPSRRQRNQREGSLLEHVRDTLEQLSKELSQVKSLVADVKAAQVHSYVGATDSMPDTIGTLWALARHHPERRLSAGH